VIAIVGSPIGRRSAHGVRAAGLPVAIARAAVVAGGTVQLVGKLGEGSDGDAVALSLAAEGIGHVALQRVPGPVPVAGAEDAVDGEAALDDLAALDGSDMPAPEVSWTPPGGEPLEAADLELALRYLPDYRVVVLAQPLEAAARAAAVDAARWSGAGLILITGSGAGDGAAASSPEEATILEAPAVDAEGAFATLVGRYAAALDAGTPAAEAFAAASATVGWAAVSD
jgi:hypothetical protein